MRDNYLAHSVQPAPSFAGSADLAYACGGGEASFQVGIAEKKQFHD